jgi:hypothetical protein
MNLDANATVEPGAIVRFEAPGSRSTQGERKLIPAVVLQEWPDGSLQLYALHFEGSFLVNRIERELVEPVLSRGQLTAVLTGFEHRLSLLEHRLAGHAQQASEPRELAFAAAAPFPEEPVSPERAGPPLKFSLAAE